MNKSLSETTSSNFSASCVTQHHLNTTKAIELVQQAIALAQSLGAAVSATVVDRSGLVIAAGRANLAGFATLEGSRRKAYTAVNTKMSSAEVEKLVRNNIELRALGDITDLLPLQGAVLIKIGDEVVGALGVGGASAAVDEQCALDAISQVLNRT